MDLTTLETFAAYVLEWRAKYSSKQLAALGAKGQAMKNASGDWSYPIGDAEDLHNAIHAVGRGGSDHNKIRKHVIKCAAKLGLSKEIPDNWNSDGSIKTNSQRDNGPATTVDGWSQENNYGQGSCPGCGVSVPAEVVDDEMRCPACNTYRGDADPSGPNADDGTYSAGSVHAPGVQDATGSVSSREPKEARDMKSDEARDCGCGCEGCTAKSDSTGAPPHNDEDGTRAVDLNYFGQLIDDCISENPILIHLDGKTIAEAMQKYVVARASQDLAVGKGAGVGKGDQAAGGLTGPGQDGKDGSVGLHAKSSVAAEAGGDAGTIDEDADDFSDAGGSAPNAASNAGATGSAGKDGSGEISDGTNVGNASTSPHPANSDTDGDPGDLVNSGAAQRENPDVDEGEGLDDGDAYDNEQISEAEGAHTSQGRSQKRYKARHASTPAPKPEHRARTSEVRASTEADGHTLNGQALVWNTPYTVYDAFGAFTERMAPGVCNGVLAKGELDCRFLINHDGLPLARTTSGTLELNNGPGGLDTVAHLSRTSNLANDLIDAIKRRDVSQMSVGFRVAEDEWDEDYMNRTIHSFAELLDVSAVTYPASPTTSIDVAKRMLYSLPVEGRSAVANAFNIVCDVRSGQRLDNECTGAVLRALEMLYSVDDPRVPLVRVREAWKIARDLRAGKQLSAHNSAFIAAALESLHRADDVDIPNIVRNLQDIDAALDGAQSALSAVSGLPNQDEGPEDWDPVLVQKQRDLDLEQAAERRRKAVAKRKRINLRVPPVQR